VKKTIFLFKLLICFSVFFVLSDSSHAYQEKQQPDESNSDLAKLDRLFGRLILEFNPSTTYLNASAYKLNPLPTDNPDTLVFEKLVDGTLVLGDDIHIDLNPANAKIHVSDSSSDRVRFVEPAAMIPEEVAMVLAEFSSGEDCVESTCEEVWFRSNGEARMAWNVTTTFAALNAGDPVGQEVVIDGETGELLSQTQISDGAGYLDPKSKQMVFPRKGRKIVVTDSFGARDSRRFGRMFSAVCITTNENCTGTLIAPNVVLSARHCRHRVGQRIAFGANSNNPEFTTRVSRVVLPDGPGRLLDGGDVAIVVLRDNVPESVASPMRLIGRDSRLVGRTIITVGYGFNGIGSVGHEFTYDRRRWAGQNRIDAFGRPASAAGSNIFSTDFDDGSTQNNTISGSSRTPLRREATTGGGDSGGPIIVTIRGERFIAGVLSGGTSDTSLFGDISWWTGTNRFRRAIELEGGSFRN